MSLEHNSWNQCITKIALVERGFGPSLHKRVQHIHDRRRKIGDTQSVKQTRQSAGQISAQNAFVQNELGPRPVGSPLNFMLTEKPDGSSNRPMIASTKLSTSGGVW
jgi:hypothetical protein